MPKIKGVNMSYNWSTSRSNQRAKNRTRVNMSGVYQQHLETLIEWLRVAWDYLIGSEWDNSKQIEYQILLIQHKLYTPSNTTDL